MGERGTPDASQGGRHFRHGTGFISGQHVHSRPLPQMTLTLRQASSAVDKADLGLLCGRLVAVNSASPLTEADGNQ
jgi:hypothetical protein